VIFAHQFVGQQIGTTFFHSTFGAKPIKRKKVGESKNIMRV
jgi:hypothetical protein